MQHGEAAHSSGNSGEIPTVVHLMTAKGNAAKESFDVYLPVTIGRTAEFQVAHDSVSRNHCVLFGRSGYVWVRDLGASNGTFVNGSRVEEDIVRPGARLSIGPMTFIVTYEPGKVATSQPNPKPATGSPGDLRSTTPLPDSGEVEGEVTIQRSKEELGLDALFESSSPQAKALQSIPRQMTQGREEQVEELRKLRSEMVKHCQATISIAQAISRMVEELIENPETE